MPRRTLAVSPDGSTLALVPDMSPTLAVVDYVGGPLDGSRLPARLQFGRLPESIRWYVGGRSWVYRLVSGTYARPVAGAILPDVPPLSCTVGDCGCPLVSSDGRRWQCAAACVLTP